MFLPLLISLLGLLFGYDEAELVFVGDAMQHQAQLDAARRPGGVYAYKGCFDSIAPILTTADYAVVNLETPVGPAPHTGYPCFNAPESYLDALSDAGFDLFLTANNHTLDRRAKGLRNTIKALDARSLTHIGTYDSDSARLHALPLVVPVNGIPIGFLNYTYGTNGITPNDGVVVDYIDREVISRDVAHTRLKGAEIVCVCIHWGEEYKLLPNKSQTSMADYLESLGVDMIIGAHPHVIQPMELRPNRYFPDKNVFLVYSLGNFISNMKTPDTRGGALARVHIVKPKDGKAEITEASHTLLFTIPGEGGKSNFRVMPAEKCKESGWKARCDEFCRRARAIFSRHNISVPEKRER